MTQTPYITGWAHGAFGKRDGDFVDLIAEVVPHALKDAELPPEDVDAVFMGVFNEGFIKQGFVGSLVSLVVPELRHTPATRIENACASGSAAVYAAMDFIESGRGGTALVIGVEKMTAVSSSQAGDNLLAASYLPEEASLPGGFAGVFAGITEEYFARYGDQSAALARLAAKNHRNATLNPHAHIRKDLGFEFCNTVSEKNPIVAGPLRRTDCSLISDGAAALVLASPDAAAAARRKVRFRSRVQVNDYLPLSKRDPIAFDGAHLAWHKALQQAGLSTFDLDLVESHDCFTTSELIQYEIFGLAERGKAADVVEQGVTERDGRLPFNLSGGLKAKGHPVGATGVSMHVLVAQQVAGEAGSLQCPDASVGAVFNMGGTGVANYVSVLEGS